MMLVLIRRREESIKAFNEVEVDLKRRLQHLRRETNKHESSYFAAVKHLDDEQLSSFSGTLRVPVVKSQCSQFSVPSPRPRPRLPSPIDTSAASDLKEVRVATSAYGKHLFGKVLLPDSNSYFMFRSFIPGGAETARVHCIHMAEVEEKDGEKTFKAIWSEQDPLEWFDE